MLFTPLDPDKAVSLAVGWPLNATVQALHIMGCIYILLLRLGLLVSVVFSSAARLLFKDKM